MDRPPERIDERVRKTVKDEGATLKIDGQTSLQCFTFREADEKLSEKLTLTRGRTKPQLLNQLALKQIGPFLKSEAGKDSFCYVHLNTVDSQAVTFHVSKQVLFVGNEFAARLLYQAIGGPDAAIKECECAVITKSGFSTKHFPVIIRAAFSPDKNIANLSNTENTVFANYTEMFLSSMVVNPCGNYKNVYFYENIPGSSQLRLRHMNHGDILLIKETTEFTDYLYYHPQVLGVIPENARRQFLALDPVAVITRW